MPYEFPRCVFRNSPDCEKCAAHGSYARVKEDCYLMSPLKRAVPRYWAVVMCGSGEPEVKQTKQVAGAYSMKKTMTLAGVTAAALLWGTGQIYAEQATAASAAPNQPSSKVLTKVKAPVGQAAAKPADDFEFKHAQTLKSARQKNQEALERLEALRTGQPIPEPSSVVTAPPAMATPYTSVQPPVGLGVNRAVDINTPNFAYSPNLRKFVDSLPGLNAPNNLGQSLPLAVPDTTHLPGIRLLRDRPGGALRENALRPSPDHGCGGMSRK